MERQDGSGFPRTLSGEAILPGAKAEIKALCRNDKLARHARIVPTATADITVKSIGARLEGRERLVARSFRLRDDIDAEFLDCPLMLAAAVRAVRAIQARKTHGHWLADLDAHHFPIETLHVGGNVDYLAGHRSHFRIPQGLRQQTAGGTEHEHTDDGVGRRAYALPTPAFPSVFVADLCFHEIIPLVGESAERT